MDRRQQATAERAPPPNSVSHQTCIAILDYGVREHWRYRPCFLFEDRPHGHNHLNMERHACHSRARHSGGSSHSYSWKERFPTRHLKSGIARRAVRSCPNVSDHVRALARKPGKQERGGHADVELAVRYERTRRAPNPTRPTLSNVVLVQGDRHDPGLRREPQRHPPLLCRDGWIAARLTRPSPLPTQRLDSRRFLQFQ